MPNEEVDPGLPKHMLIHIISRLSFYQRLVHQSLQDFKEKLVNLKEVSVVDDSNANESRLSVDHEVANRLISRIDLMKRRKDVKRLKQKLSTIFAQYKFLQFLVVQLNYAKIELDNQEAGRKSKPVDSKRLKRTLAEAAGCPHINNIFKGLKPID